MAPDKLLVGPEKYESVATSALYEAEFERLVIQQSEMMYPDFLIVPFKSIVYSDISGARPDLALIHRGYRAWWIVEVELAHHSLHGHVLPQVRTLMNAVYSDAEASALGSQEIELNSDALLEMMKGRPPRVLVISNEFSSEWDIEIGALGGKFAALEVYRTATNSHAYRFVGEQLFEDPAVLSECHLDPILPGFVLVHSPAGLAVPSGSKVDIRYQRGVTEWRRVDAQDRVWLTPIGANPLRDRTTYILMKDRSGSYHLLPKDGQ